MEHLVRFRTPTSPRWDLLQPVAWSPQNKGGASGFPLTPPWVGLNPCLCLVAERVGNRLGEVALTTVFPVPELEVPGLAGGDVTALG